MTISIKICGINNEAAAKTVADSGADYAGFIHFPASPRHVSAERAAALKALLPESTQSVAVLIDPDDAAIDTVQRILQPDFIQLHGKETPERITQLRVLTPAKFIKAIGIATADDIAQAMQYDGYADIILFDAAPPKNATLPGGNGVAFDWTILKQASVMLPWFLSGGLHAGNIAEAVRESGAHMVDISSGVERAPGVKDPARIVEFIETVRGLTVDT